MNGRPAGIGRSYGRRGAKAPHQAISSGSSRSVGGVRGDCTPAIEGAQTISEYASPRNSDWRNSSQVQVGWGRFSALQDDPARSKADNEAPGPLWLRNLGQAEFQRNASWAVRTTILWHVSSPQAIWGVCPCQSFDSVCDYPTRWRKPGRPSDIVGIHGLGGSPVGGYLASRRPSPGRLGMDMAGLYELSSSGPRTGPSRRERRRHSVTRALGISQRTRRLPFHPVCPSAHCPSLSRFVLPHSDSSSSNHQRGSSSRLNEFISTALRLISSEVRQP